MPAAGANILFASRGQKAYPPADLAYFRFWDSKTGFLGIDPLDTATMDDSLAAVPKSKVTITFGRHHVTAVSDADYIKALLAVKARSNQIEAFEIANEPNNTPDAYVSVDDLGHRAQLARKYLDGHVLIVGPATEGFGETKPGSYLQTFLAKYGQYVDVVSHHFYCHSDWLTTPGYYNAALNFAKLVKAMCPGKQLWATEYNLMSLAAGSVKGTAAHNFMLNYTKGLFDGGVDRAYFWGWGNTDMPVNLANLTAPFPEGTDWITSMRTLI